MKMKKITALITACVLVTAALAGCGRAAGTPEDNNGVQTGDNDASSDNISKPEAGDKVELNYYAWSEGDYLQEIVDAYNASSTLAHVKLTTVASSDYDDKLVTMLAGDNDIDLYNMRSASLLSKLANSGNLADMTDYIKNAGLDVSIYGTGYADTQIDNKFYGLPYRAQSYALFYNRKIFDDKQIPYPDNLTWDEYAALAKQLTQGEGQDKVYGGYIPEWLYTPFITLQEGSNIADDDLTATQDWLEMLNKLYNEDGSHMSYSDMVSTGTDYINFFCSGKAAMLPNGEWCVSDIKAFLEENPDAAADFELGIAVIPQVGKSGSPITAGGVSTFVGINATSEKQEAAFDFASYLAGEECAKIIARAGMIPAYTSDNVIAAYEETIGVDGAGNLLDVNKVFEGLFFNEFSEIQSAYQEEKELYLIGEQSIEDTMLHFSERRNEIMGK
jgi:multiple sugar transport system substrate-binding protein